MLSSDNSNNDKKEGECFRFVIHERQTKSLKHVLRLEKDGVLNCWVLPKGFPQNAKDKCIAVSTDDCKTDMLYFHGVKHFKNSMAELSIHDSGKYEILMWSDLKIEFIMTGKENSGRYVLVKFEKAGSKTWILMKAE